MRFVIVNVVAWTLVHAAARWVAHRLPNRWLGADPSSDYAAALDRQKRRTEMGHRLAVLTAPLFFLWSPWYAAAAVHVYAVAGPGVGLKIAWR